MNIKIICLFDILLLVEHKEIYWNKRCNYWWFEFLYKFDFTGFSFDFLRAHPLFYLLSKNKTFASGYCSTVHHNWKQTWKVFDKNSQVPIISNNTRFYATLLFNIFQAFFPIVKQNVNQKFNNRNIQRKTFTHIFIFVLQVLWSILL